MKPHEETWRAYQSGKANYGISRPNPRRTSLRTDDDCWHIAACDGIRSLVDCIEMCGRVRSTLKNAGVLP